jgi:hypothetical protein
MQFSRYQELRLQNGSSKQPWDLKAGDVVSPEPLNGSTAYQILIEGGGTVAFLANGVVSWVTRNDGDEVPRYIAYEDHQRVVLIDRKHPDYRGGMDNIYLTGWEPYLVADFVGYPPKSTVCGWQQEQALALAARLNSYEHQLQAVQSSSCCAEIVGKVQDADRNGNRALGIIPQRVAVELTLKKHLEKARAA